MTTMSPDLIAFLRAWHDWATNGAPDNEPFSRRCGLCGNAGRYGLRKGVMDVVFKCLFPFGRGEYHRRFLDRSQHECPKRLAWVRERLIEAGELTE